MNSKINELINEVRGITPDGPSGDKIHRVLIEILRLVDGLYPPVEYASAHSHNTTGQCPQCEYYHPRGASCITNEV